MHRHALLLLAFWIGGSTSAQAAIKKEDAAGPYVPPPSATRLRVTAWRKPHLKLKQKKKAKILFSLDGKSQGRTPWEGQVSPGKHTVKLNGIFNAKKTVHVSEGQTGTINIHFRYGPVMILVRGVGYVLVGALAILGAAAGSDERMKQDIVRVGQSPSGIPIYRFRYRPEFGNPNVCHEGVMAQDLVENHTHALVQDRDGLFRVRYGLIDVRHRRLPLSACTVGAQ